MHIDVPSHLPLTEPTLYILLGIVPGKRHGYGILNDVDALSGEEVNPSTSTLYTGLRRLLSRRLALVRHCLLELRDAPRALIREHWNERRGGGDDNGSGI